MIRPVIRKLVVLPTRLLWKRTVYNAWHLEDRVAKLDQYKEFTEDLWNRRVFIGPDEQKPRSEDFLWDYEAELFAFGNRLGEEFQMATLRRAFLHSSYKPPEGEEQLESDDSESPKTNEELISVGASILGDYVPAYLRYHFRKLPEEGIHLISAYLCSDKQLAYIARNLGMFDLTLAANFPFDDSTMAHTFKAVVGALEVDSNEQKAEYFVQDFVLTELVDMDINEIFYVKNPMRLLSLILEKSGKGQPDPRILRQSGVFTVTPVYLIGVFVDGQILGQSPGETLQIAEEMAARDCLKTLWGTQQNQCLPLTFGVEAGRKLDVNGYKERKNESLRNVLDFNDEIDLIERAAPDEPFKIEEMYQKYKEEIEPTLGRVYRRKLKHFFYHGSLAKHVRRPVIQPNVKTI